MGAQRLPAALPAHQRRARPSCSGTTRHQPHHDSPLADLTDQRPARGQHLGERLRTPHRRARHHLAHHFRCRESACHLAAIHALLSRKHKQPYLSSLCRWSWGWDSSAPGCQRHPQVEREPHHAPLGRALPDRHGRVPARCLCGTRRSPSGQVAGIAAAARWRAHRGRWRTRVQRPEHATDLQWHHHRDDHHFLLPAVQLQALRHHNALHGSPWPDAPRHTHRPRHHEPNDRPYQHLRSHHAHGHDHAQRDPHLRACG